MLIHLLRHAEAEVTSATGRDADRKLTAAGRKRMRLVAKAIAGLEPVVRRHPRLWLPLSSIS